MNLILAFIAFNFIVIVHELGHFFVAKLTDIKVLEFSLFVGPKLFSIKKGETTYSLRLLPILAYVKMEGEEEESDSERAFNKKPIWTRAAVIAAGPLANLVIAVIVLCIVFSVTGFTTNRLSNVEEKSPAYNAALKEGDIILKYDGKSVYQPMDLIQFLYVYKGRPAEVEYNRGGQRFTTSISPTVIPEQERYLFGFNAKQINGELSNVVGAVASDTPAAKAGLQDGDVIKKLNQSPISSKKDIDHFMADNKGNPVKMTVVRNGSEIVLDIVPYVSRLPEQYYLGIEFELQKGSFPGVLKHSILFAYSTARNVAYSLGWLITGRVSLNEMTGPVGIVSSIGDAVEQGTTFLSKLLYLLNITAFISIAIGATNLIPFPALDGNKLLLLLIEGIRKKPIPPEKEAFISMIGFVILIALAIFTIYNDTLRLIMRR
ncbi:MAG TPA: RIP metalloprotease RseP [Clostridiales bacterium]|nr:RIP metalloprotease RseP [Clostridiales bacterium]